MFKPCSKKQQQMIAHDAEVFFIGGACGGGKSEILTALPGRYLQDPLFTGTMVRSTVSQLMKPGNLWTKANKMYAKLPKEFRPRFLKGDRKVAVFPHGPEIEYTYLKTDGDEENFQGAEYTLIGLDEALQMQFHLIQYLFSRMRSPSSHPSRLVMSGNPHPDHEIADMIKWYLDDEGYPHPEREGTTRYFITHAGEFVWSDNPEDLIENYKTEIYTPKPLSFSFLSSTIYDNPICMDQNPGYVSFLEGLPAVEKARLLHGNWFARPEGANYFKRENLNKINAAPLDIQWCRPWDKASAIPTDVEKFPDRTACMKMGKNSNGEFFIGLFPHPDNRDDWETERYGSFRAKPGKRDNIILKQAQFDGEETQIVLPQDPGAAGQSEYQESAKKLAQHGFIVKKDPSVPNKSKLTKFSPFAAAVENGLVYIIESSFPNRHTLEAFYKELEAFDGSPSTRKRKDDWVDVVATGYNYLSKSIVIPKFTLPQSGTNTNIRKLKAQVSA
jgi:predicted phage terminase large subunit-like protein